MSDETTPITRSLFAWEVQEARRVFGNGLAYEQIRIHECAGWPDTLDRIGRLLRGMPAPIQPNAVTLGNHCYFPVRLPDSLVEPDAPEHQKIGWLMHELAHTWQFQRMGWGYLRRAIAAQFNQGSLAYFFGGEAGLAQAALDGKKFADFNLEQQGEICRSFYIRLTHGLNVNAWQPFIEQLQTVQNE